MNKFWIILLFTFASKLKSKSFILTTVITCLLVTGLSNIDKVVKGTTKEDRILQMVVVTDQLSLYDDFKKEFNEKHQLHHMPLAKEKEAEKLVRKGVYQSMLIIKPDQENWMEASYKANTVTDEFSIMIIKDALENMKTSMVKTDLNLTDQEAKTLFSPVELKKVPLLKEAKEEKELTQSRKFVQGMLFLLYFSVLFYGTMIATEIAAEKSLRVMEIIISSVSPVKHMFAKILGIGLLGFFQYGIFFVVGWLNVQMDSAQEKKPQPSLWSEIEPATLAYAILFFILGYLLYGTLLAVLASLVSRVEEVHQMMTPVTFTIMFGFILSLIGLADPNAHAITIGSFIPFFSPVLMFLRMELLAVPFWQVACSLAILIATVCLFSLVGAKVYRGGVLLYGKNNVWKTIKRAWGLSKRD